MYTIVIWIFNPTSTKFMWLKLPNNRVKSSKCRHGSWKVELQIGHPQPFFSLANVTTLAKERTTYALTFISTTPLINESRNKNYININTIVLTFENKDILGNRLSAQIVWIIDSLNLFDQLKILSIDYYFVDCTEIFDKKVLIDCL